MKALTILQPWAHAIVWADKRVENRQWRTSYRGPLAIHAGKGQSEMGGLGWGDALRQIGAYTHAATSHPMQFGAVIAVCELVDCVAMPHKPHNLAVVAPELRSWFAAESLRWASGPFCWLLRDIRPIEPAIVCKGAPALWDFECPGG